MRDIYLLSQSSEQFLDTKKLSIFDIKYISFDIDFSIYDALVITSKNAVLSLESNQQWKNIPTYAIAKKTADIIIQNGGDVSYIGSSGHGDDFANELISKLKGKKVLYVRALKVVSNLVNILNSNNIICDEVITYKTICKKYERKEKPPKNSIIIFSSPSTIKCFLDNFKWDDSYLAISIGNTTAAYFPNYVNYKIAEETSLESCVKLARTFI